LRALLPSTTFWESTSADKGQTALRWAAADGHAEVVSLLLAAGAEFKAALPSGFTPLLSRHGNVLELK
jgi:ankyrin repeat protein